MVKSGCGGDKSLQKSKDTCKYGCFEVGIKCLSLKVNWEVGFFMLRLSHAKCSMKGLREFGLW